MLFYMTQVLFNYVLGLRTILNSKQNWADHPKFFGIHTASSNTLSHANTLTECGNLRSRDCHVAVVLTLLFTWGSLLLVTFSVLTKHTSTIIVSHRMKNLFSCLATGSLLPSKSLATTHLSVSIVVCSKLHHDFPCLVARLFSALKSILLLCFPTKEHPCTGFCGYTFNSFGQL